MEAGLTTPSLAIQRALSARNASPSGTSPARCHRQAAACNAMSTTSNPPHAARSAATCSYRDAPALQPHRPGSRRPSGRPSANRSACDPPQLLPGDANERCLGVLFGDGPERAERKRGACTQVAQLCPETNPGTGSPTTAAAPTHRLHAPTPARRRRIQVALRRGHQMVPMLRRELVPAVVAERVVSDLRVPHRPHPSPEPGGHPHLPS